MRLLPWGGASSLAAKAPFIRLPCHLSNARYSMLHMLYGGLHGSYKWSHLSHTTSSVIQVDLVNVRVTCAVNTVKGHAMSDDLRWDHVWDSFEDRMSWFQRSVESLEGSCGGGGLGGWIFFASDRDIGEKWSVSSLIE